MPQALSPFSRLHVVLPSDGSGYRFLSRPLAYLSRTERLFVVPAGFKTDLASTPRLLWPIIPPFGRHTKAAVVHDYLYATAKVPRKRADRILYEAVLDADGSWCLAAVMYLGVRIGGWVAWKNHRKNDS